MSERHNYNSQAIWCLHWEFRKVTKRGTFLCFWYLICIYAQSLLYHNGTSKQTWKLKPYSMLFFSFNLSPNFIHHGRVILTKVKRRPFLPLYQLKYHRRPVAQWHIHMPSLEWYPREREEFYSPTLPWSPPLLPTQKINK